MNYPCNDCVAQCNYQKCTRWQRWFLDEWGTARVGVLARICGIEKAVSDGRNTGDGNANGNGDMTTR
jgi:hypothetical protein